MNERPTVIAKLIGGGILLLFLFAPILYAGQTTGLQTSGGMALMKKNPSTYYTAGMAKIDITPDIQSQRVPFAGYFDRHKKPATSVHDPLFARALVVSDPLGNLFALVSLDLCYVHSEVRDPVVTRLSRLGFTEHNLMISATHSHSGFGGYDRRWLSKTLFGAFDQRLLDIVVNGIYSAVAQAKASMRPARVDLAFADLKGKNRSRRDPAFDVGVGGGKGTQHPDTSKYPTNRTLTVMNFSTVEGQPIGVVFNFSAHPTILSPKNFAISAEWPGVACDRIEKHLGFGSVSMFLNGSLGDAAPSPDWSTLEAEWKAMDDYGNQMADEVVGLLKASAPMEERPLVGRSTRREFSQLVIRPLWRMKLTKRMSKIGYARMDQPLQSYRLGSIVFLGVPGEPTTAVGNELIQLCPKGHRCLVVAPTNGYLGYFVDSEEYEENRYAADSCMFGPDAYEKVREGLREALKPIR